MTTSPSHAIVRTRLKTRQAMLFVSLAEESNMHRAADKLGMTQPAASRLLKELEDQFDVKFFERHPRGLKPTWYGEIMIRHARAILSSMDQAHLEISEWRAGLQGSIRLGAIIGPATTLIPRLIVRLQAQAPKVRVSVLMDSSQELDKLLQDGGVDIVLARQVGNSKTSHVNHVFKKNVIYTVVVNVNHPLADASSLELSELMDYAWILPPSSSVLMQYFEGMLRRQKLVMMANPIETVALPVLTNLIQQTHMVALLETDVAQIYAKHGMMKMLPIELDFDMDPYCIITAQNRALSPSVQMALSTLKELSMV